jgi:hypothetical protein
MIIWLSVTWAKIKEAKKDGAGMLNIIALPDGSSYSKFIQKMAPHWKDVMTDAEKRPWIKMSQEEFRLQNEQIAQCGLKLRSCQVGWRLRTFGSCALIKEVSEWSSFGGQGMRVGMFHVHSEASALGAGSFGQVFQAIHTVTGQRAALKIFGNGKGALDSMKREIEIYRTVQAVKTESEAMDSSSFFLRVMGYSVAPVPWICLEDGGRSLRDIMKSGDWELPWLYPVASQLRLALQHMHNAGLAHLDVKPANIVLDSARMCLRIIDMGMAEQWRGASLPALRYEVYVTEWYRPPELFDIDCDQLDRALLPMVDWRPRQFPVSILKARARKQ